MDVLRETEILEYLLQQIEAVNKYMDGINNEDEFLRHDMAKNATLTRLMVLGEYTDHLDVALKNRFTEVQWRLIKAARNFYAHAYNGIDWKQVWVVVDKELPELKKKIENILQLLREEHGKTN